MIDLAELLGFDPEQYADAIQAIRDGRPDVPAGLFAMASSANFTATAKIGSAVLGTFDASFTAPTNVSTVFTARSSATPAGKYIHAIQFVPVESAIVVASDTDTA